MPEKPEKFSRNEQRALKKLDFFDAEVDDNLTQWRRIGESWSRRLVAAYRSGPGHQQDMHEAYLRDATTYYMTAFVATAKAVTDNSLAVEHSRAILDTCIEAEDAALIKPVNDWFKAEKLSPLSPDIRDAIVAPFADNDRTMLPPDRDAQTAALGLYGSQLRIRAELILIEAHYLDTPKPRSNHMRTALGVVGIGSLLSLGFIAKRHRV